MAEKVRPIIAVVAAEVNCIEQRQVLMGIIEQAQALNVDIAVISNVFNAYSDDDKNFQENEIYELVRSKDIDGIIFISESFLKDALKSMILQLFTERSDLPVISVGNALPELASLKLRSINTDDETDIEDITDHLIDCHGFTDIDMMTGGSEIAASGMRVNGYKRSLKKHGIPFVPEKVHTGNFWMNSGEELAEKYVSGEIPMPQAVVCANDYMAYGILDKLMEHNVPVPERMTVVGYEHIWERIYHAPLLTTYQRSRAELGKAAVRIIFADISGNECEPFSPPRGKMICGQSCPCARSDRHLEELKAAQNANMYADWHISSPMYKQLTNCTNVDEFADVMGQNSFMIRYVQDMYLCLSEKWYDESAADHDIISCRSVQPWLDNSVMLMNKYDISRIFAKNKQAAAYYFSPLFFGEKTFGYTVLKYESPDTYDVVYKNWIRSLGNSLEFMRMKNDIRYFTAYDRLSEQYDSQTGIYNENGFANGVKYAVNTAENDKKVIFILLKVFPPDDTLETLDSRLTAASEIAGCLRELSRKSSDISGRIGRELYGFAAVGGFPEGYAGVLCDKLRLMVTYRTSCVRNWGLHSFDVAVEELSADGFDYGKALASLTEKIEETERRTAGYKLISGSSKFLECRTGLCLAPHEEHEMTKICHDFGLSEGHFRKLYKDYFGESFHHDLLIFRINYAKYLLCTTSLDISTVASKCGYIDTKYFLRIFHKNTGFTAKQYRDMFK